MKVVESPMDGVLVIDLKSFDDERGFFRETFQLAAHRAVGIHDAFVQDNHSRSIRGVLRGLHFRLRNPQAQIVTVIQGEIFDVVVDIRPDSETFGRWFGATLSAEGPQQVYMAPGFAHGFCVLSDSADLHYKVSKTFDPTDERGIHWADPTIAIAWPIEAPIVSDRDSKHPRLQQLTDQLGQGSRKNQDSSGHPGG